jgi:peptide/nickel transport system permease protein
MSESSISTSPPVVLHEALSASGRRWRWIR